MNGRPLRDGQFPNRFFQPVCNDLRNTKNFARARSPALYTFQHPHTVPPNNLLAFQSRADRPSRLSLSLKQTSFDGTLKNEPRPGQVEVLRI